MTTLAQVDLGQSVEEGLTTVLNFIPSFLAFIAILVIGYLVARVLQRIVNEILERVGFDRAVERGGVEQVLSRTRYDASDVLAKLVFYAVMLLVLQLAFGVFGPNPISELLFGIIAFLPNVFVAIIIVVIAAAIAAAVRELVDTAIGSLSYGHLLANLAAAVIIAVGVFAALDQLEIAPAIVNGLFYALLAIIAGIAIVAVGGGGIVPMRERWERALARLDDESERIREEATSTTREDLRQRFEERREQVTGGHGAAEDRVERQHATTQLVDERSAHVADRAGPSVGDDRLSHTEPLVDEGRMSETQPWMDEGRASGADRESWMDEGRGSGADREPWMEETRPAGRPLADAPLARDADDDRPADDDLRPAADDDLLRKVDAADAGDDPPEPRHAPPEPRYPPPEDERRRRGRGGSYWQPPRR